MKYNPDDPRITTYVFDELESAERAEFEAELQTSAELQQQVEAIRATIESVRADLGRSKPLQLTDVQREAVRAHTSESDAVVPDNDRQIVAAAREQRPSEHARFGWWLAAAGTIAATLLVAAGIGVWRFLSIDSSPMVARAKLQDISTDGGSAVADQRFARAIPQTDTALASEMDTNRRVLPGGALGEIVAGTPHPQSGEEVAIQELHEQSGGRSTGSVVTLGEKNTPRSYANDLSVAVSNAPNQVGQGQAGSGQQQGAGSSYAPASTRDRYRGGYGGGYGRSGGGGGLGGGGYGSGYGLAPGGQPSSSGYGGGGYGGEAGGYGGAGYGSGYGSGDDTTGVTSELPRFRKARPLEDEEELNLLPGNDGDRGRGPGEGGDQYDVIVENDFLRVTDAPLSTFSIDVDTASYSKVRQYLNEHQQLPRPDAVRIEELVNYFPYHYEPPAGEDPFAAYIEAATCPWNADHQLVRIGIKGQEIAHDERPASNLVFLLDVSGSMDQPNKLPLVKRGMQMLTRQLTENDRVAIVVYAGAAGLVLDSTTGDQQPAILNALERLQAGGSTNGGAGIHLAYQLALDHFIQGGTNRVILCTDGDFNVGTTGTDELVRIVENNAKSGVFLSVLGFGMGNHNDAMLEQISGKGNGNYAFVDTDNEAKKVLVEQLAATLITIAKDVKIQVEFNPAKVAAYRLIGYENRLLAAQDFNDDTKDAGEIGAGHTVTALYELVPAGEEVAAAPPVDELKYQTRIEPTDTAENGELLTLKLRYKQPDGDTSKLLQFPLKETDQAFSKADRDYQFAAAVASFGMLLRNSKHKGDATYASVLEIATPAAADDASGYRREFLELIRKAAQLSGESIGVRGN